MRKKPLPLIARSSGLLVVLMLPCENCCSTALILTPMPIALAPEPPRELA
jgi:hypothetical protein